MKIIGIAASISLLLVTSSYSAVTLNFQAGYAFDSFNAAVPDGTPYALMVSTDDTFAGGFGLNEGLATSGDANEVFSIGQTFSVGDTVGGDTVFGVGVFNGEAVSDKGIITGSLAFDLGTNGLVAGRKFAFYFFPGGGLMSSTITVGNEVGGVNSNTTEAGLDSMVVPPEGNTVSIGYATTDAGGSISNAKSTSVLLVPEPSTFLLGALSVLALLRRKR